MATMPPNHGSMSAVQVSSFSVAAARIRSNVSSSFVSIGAWSSKPGKADRNDATFWRWSPGRSNRYSMYWTASVGHVADGDRRRRAAGGEGDDRGGHADDEGDADERDRPADA